VTLAHDRIGEGPPLLLIHGTPASRRIWDAVAPRLAEEREVIAVDLPGFGDSPPMPGAVRPRDWVTPVAETLNALGHDAAVSIVGSSMGGWTALELALAGRASAVLALGPAGLWRKASPRITNARIRGARLAGRLGGPLAARVLERPALRRIAMRDQSADAGRVPAAWAVQAARDAARAPGWPAHFRAATRDRFSGGARIDVPIHVVFGNKDRIVSPGKADFTDELPAHAVVETWEGCGHLMMWDATDRVVEAALAL
jgi:pimeloyl-ACP methyl ester carboxylesterase